MTNGPNKLSSELTFATLAVASAYESANEQPPNFERMRAALAAAASALERSQSLIQHVRCDIQTKLDSL